MSSWSPPLPCIVGKGSSPFFPSVAELQTNSCEFVAFCGDLNLLLLSYPAENRAEERFPIALEAQLGAFCPFVFSAHSLPPGCYYSILTSAKFKKKML